MNVEWSASDASCRRKEARSVSSFPNMMAPYAMQVYGLFACEQEGSVRDAVRAPFYWRPNIISFIYILTLVGPVSGPLLEGPSVSSGQLVVYWPWPSHDRICGFRGFPNGFGGFWLVLVASRSPCGVLVT